MDKIKKAVLIFPPNWSACVYAPHLALPLLAGVARGLHTWNIETWDLSSEFYKAHAVPPRRDELITASKAGDFENLDKMYFCWEDKLRLVSAAGGDLGLLSGYQLSRYRSLPLSEAVKVIEGEGTIYTDFLENDFLSRLVEANPLLVGITIASVNQVIPAIEILKLVRSELPGSFVLLGGNVVTRLRQSPAFEVLKSLSDQIVLFQGERSFLQTMQAIRSVGVRGARQRLPHVVQDESIPCELWPVPCFDGISFDDVVGVPVLPYVSTRGCYWGKCPFCAIPAGWSTTGYGGSAPARFVAKQLVQMFAETGLSRVKFVDEAMPLNKIGSLCDELKMLEVKLEWEAYARLEKGWEDAGLLESAKSQGLRKLYFGLEQAPSTSRRFFGKEDSGDPYRILQACNQTGVKVHFFCMVGLPGTSYEDAESTVEFLLDNESLIDTADLVGFQFERGTSVPGIRPLSDGASDWATSLPYEPIDGSVLSAEQVSELEMVCQEKLWESVPRLLHPLYRLVGHWDEVRAFTSETCVLKKTIVELC